MKNILKKPNLFLDDIRLPHDVTWGNIPHIYQKLEWDIVRNYDEFVSYIRENGLPKGYISFDHDIHESQYTPEEYWNDFTKSKEYQLANPSKEKTGLDCAKFLVEYCLYHGFDLPNWKVHSMNPVGRENIISELNSYYKRLKTFKSKFP